MFIYLSTVIHLWDLIIHAHVLYCKKIEDAMGGSCWQLPLFLHWIMRNEYSWDHVLKQVRPHFFPPPFFFYLCILLHSVGANVKAYAVALMADVLVQLLPSSALYLVCKQYVPLLLILCIVDSFIWVVDSRARYTHQQALVLILLFSSLVLKEWNKFVSCN